MTPISLKPSARSGPAGRNWLGGGTGSKTGLRVESAGIVSYGPRVQHWAGSTAVSTGIRAGENQGGQAAAAAAPVRAVITVLLLQSAQRPVPEGPVSAQPGHPTASRLTTAFHFAVLGCRRELIAR